VGIKGYFVFLIPGVYAMYEGVVTLDFDVVPIIVSLVATTVGSSVQLSEKRMDRSVRNKEIVFVYVTGVMVAILAHGIWLWKENLFYLAGVSVICSYMSLELLGAVKNAILKVVGFLPDIVRTYLLSKLNANEKDTKDNDSVN
jgi:hypothetical protein